MNKTDNKCRNCKFFDKHGKCRRYPPKAFMVKDAETMKFIRHLPDVMPHEYCGEFELKYNNAPATIS